jgi:two-component system sensor histidine kinase AlgZ
MASINQNPYPITLPNFCNLGVALRILLMMQGAAMVIALAKSVDLAGVWRELIDISVLLQPVLLLSLVLLYMLNKQLKRLPYWQGAIAVVVVELALTSVVYAFLQPVYGGYDAAPLVRYWLFCLAATGAVLGYFHLRSRALSPALTEARLQALQARIRPHFLFNSINAVLSLIRSEPKRAERALEDMADLFRVLMADNRELAPIEREVELCRQYLELEQLRLGDRLQVAWHTENMPSEALIPPLLLQPLVENAVYHGIEPSSQPGEVNINIYRHRNQVHLVIRNPYQFEGGHHAGNKMALANIRERLALHFDVEASLESKVVSNAYQVHIIIPYTVAGK